MPSNKKDITPSPEQNLDDLDHWELRQEGVDYRNFRDLARCYEYLFCHYRGNRHSESDGLRSKLLSKLTATKPGEACFIIEALQKTASIDGDICEFGVGDGKTSALIANEIASGNKHLHLFDSFKGLPEPSEKDLLKDDFFSLGSISAYQGSMHYQKSEVLRSLEDISFSKKRYTVYSGLIEEVLEKRQNLPELISFAYLDFDFYQPTKVALQYLDNSLTQDGIIIVDDYDYFSTGVKTAVKEFLESSSSKYELEVPDTVFGYFAILTRR